MRQRHSVTPVRNEEDKHESREDEGAKGVSESAALEAVWAAVRNQNNSSKDLYFSISRAEYSAFLDDLYSGKNPAADYLRHSYDDERRLLKIDAMATTKVHNYIIDFVHWLLKQMEREGFLTPEEGDKVGLDVGSGYQIAKQSIQISTKQPDAAIRVVPEYYPRIVFEVGFSEPYEELKRDMRTWLCKTERAVRKAFLIKIIEWKIPVEPIANESEPDVEKLVGPFSIFLEEYRFCEAAQDIEMVGPRIHISTYNLASPQFELPEFHTSAEPPNVILATDSEIDEEEQNSLDPELFAYSTCPLSFRRSDFASQEDSSFNVPLQRYKSGVLEARKDLAEDRWRKMMQKEKRRFPRTA